MTIRRVLGVLIIVAACSHGFAALSDAERRIVDAVDAQMEGFSSDLERAVQIDSTTENLAGVRKQAEQFQAMLANLGFDARFIEMPATMGRAGHLVAEHHGDRGRRVLMIGHLDTVLPGENFRRSGDRALGSGTSDIKGGDLVLVYALKALQAAGALQGARIRVVMTGDEEAVGRPVEKSRAVLFDAAKESDVALSFEEAIGNTATIARRGNCHWRIEVQGATGHSSAIFSAAMGAGSVYEAARILSAFYAEFRTWDGLTLNPALIVGGTEATLDRTGGKAAGKSNITAQRTLLRGDLRTLSAAQLSDAQRRMSEIVAANLPRTSAKISFDQSYPAMPDTPENRALLGELDKVSRDLGFAPLTAYDPKGRGAGDVAFVSPPLPAIDGLGLRGGGAHAPSEWADLSSAPELVKRTAILVYRLTR